MEGRRVHRSAPKRNPLYLLFLCLVAAVFILLIVVIVMGAKLGSTNRALKAAEKQVEELQEQIKGQITQDPDDPDAPDVPTQDLDDSTGEDPDDQTDNPGKQLVVDWLDLTGHEEVTVLPKALFQDYSTNYTTDGVNLRSGPGTSHNKIKTLDRGTAVKAAAKEGEWTFVNAGSQFGWIKSEYLSVNKPATPQAEATSGNLNR